MSFPDFPFNEELDKFLSADDVMQYLHQYADAFNLKALIKVWFLALADFLIYF